MAARGDRPSEEGQPHAFGSWLAAARQDARLSKSALSRKLDMAWSHYYKMEAGRTGPPRDHDRLRRLARLLDRPLWEVYERAGALPEDWVELAEAKLARLAEERVSRDPDRSLAFAEWLATKRESAGLTMSELARSLKMAWSHYHGVEKGTLSPPQDFDRLRRLARLLNQPVADVLEQAEAVPEEWLELAQRRRHATADDDRPDP